MYKFAAGLLIAILFIFWSMGSDTFKDVTYKEVIVQEGQSLFVVAEQSNVDADLRDIIAYMKDKNDIQGTVIHPGQTILVPME
jgi:hypothetical protein